MTHIITSLCLRDRGCIEVCPVECIVPGKAKDGWPWMYIDPDTCIDCGACVPECPWEAIFPEDEVPDAFNSVHDKDGNLRRLSKPTDPNFADRATEEYEGESKKGTVKLDCVVTLAEGDVVNLKGDIQPNYDFFKGDNAPGYAGKDD